MKRDDCLILHKQTRLLERIKLLPCDARIKFHRIFEIFTFRFVFRVIFNSQLGYFIRQLEILAILDQGSAVSLTQLVVNFYCTLG